MCIRDRCKVPNCLNATRYHLICYLLCYINTVSYTHLEKTISVDYDKNRLEQELIYYIEKLDINEEKQRLSNHLRYFRETMAGVMDKEKNLVS